MLKTKALQVFNEYISHYDSANVNIKLKIDHTYRVADICETIAASVGAETDVAWLLGLLHDIGRFEQYTVYRTFIDRDSVDHAELGADILFQPGTEGTDPLITCFPEALFTVSGEVDGKAEWMKVLETAIRLHNKLILPDNLDPVTNLYCRVIRTSDKVDIVRVLTEPPYDDRNRRIVECSRDGSIPAAREEVMKYVYEHRCVPRKYVNTDFERLISQCCMAFELDFEIAWFIVKKQGYLSTLMNLPVEDGVMASQLAALRTEMKHVWES